MLTLVEEVDIERLSDFYVASARYVPGKAAIPN